MSSTISREVPVNRDGVGFRVNGFDNGDILYEVPNDTNLANAYLAFISHEHHDHFGPLVRLGKEILAVVPKHMDTMMAYRGQKIDAIIPNRRTLEKYTPERIRGNIEVTSIPFTHSTPSTEAYYVVLPNGFSIFFGTDVADGKKTEKSLDWARRLRGKVDLLIADASGFGSTPLSLHEQVSRIKQALKFAKSHHVPTEIIIKAGNVGVIEHWLQNSVFDSTEVFFPQKHMRLIQELGLLDRWRKKYNFTPQTLVNPKDQLRPNRENVVIYDDKWNEPLAHMLSVIINATRHEIPMRINHTVAVFLAGLSGHSGKAFEDLVSVLQPKNLAVTHPPHKGKLPEYHNINLILKQVRSWSDLGKN